MTEGRKKSNPAQKWGVKVGVPRTQEKKGGVRKASEVQKNAAGMSGPGRPTDMKRESEETGGGELRKYSSMQ